MPCGLIAVFITAATVFCYSTEHRTALLFSVTTTQSNRYITMSDNTVPPQSRNGAATAWITEELRQLQYGDQQVRIVRAALEKLENCRRITVSMLTTRLQRLLEPSDSQAEDDVASLAEVAFDCMAQFNILYQVDACGFYKYARLTRSLLEEQNLTDYIEAADHGKHHAKARLDFLTKQQSTDCNNEPNGYVCLLASSGTGKTQLAATASLTYDKATTIYLNIGTGESQSFYRPHINEGSRLLKEEIKSFLTDRAGSKEGRKRITANEISTWASSDLDDGGFYFVRILYHLLTREPFIPPTGTFETRMKLKALKKHIEKTKYLVFLDEVPPKGSEEYPIVLCLRDIFRYLGIAPILMSTHTGAQDYVGSISRYSLDVWTWVVSTLPKYEPFPENPPAFLVKSERPIVLQYAKRHLSKECTLSEIIHGLQRMMQQRKPQAWSLSPSLQLVQLFSTDVDLNGQSFASAHKLVGHHFGCLLQGGEDGKKSYNCFEAQKLGVNLTVAPVSAAKEPLLYLTLVTWDETMLQENSQILFPLVNEKERALTVRGAFERCRADFTSNASTGNPKAEKADGDLLEVLVHASFTLASMKTSSGNNNEYLTGMCLKKFIPLVRALMLDQCLDKLPPVPRLFNELDFDWPLVPALGGSESGLPKELSEFCGSPLGYLERPEDNAMTDGLISYIHCDGKESTGPFISIECKNYSGGVDSSILKKVFQRIRGGIQCGLIFVSHIQQGAFQQTVLENVRSSCFAKHRDSDAVSVIQWNMDNSEPAFFHINGEPFKAKKETSLLVVIISVGHIDACISRKRRRLDRNCANC